MSPLPWKRGRQPIEGSLRQLVVFSLKGFVQDLISSRIEEFYTAMIAGSHQDRDPAMDVSFVAPLPKCDSFHAFSNTPFFADFTNDGFVFGGHRPHPLAVALTSLRGTTGRRVRATARS